VQSALTSGKYNGFIVDPVDGTLECKLFTTEAAAKHIPAVVLTNPLCGRAQDNGVAAWAPGSTAFVGGNDLEAFNEDYFDSIAAANPHAQVAVLSGPLLNGATITTQAAMKATQKKYPNFDVIATYNTDFTSATGLQDTQTLLSAHPNVNTIISIYTGITGGAVSALRSAGKAGQIKLYGEGGDTTDVTAIKSGVLTETVPLYPASTGIAAVNELALLAKGQGAPRYLGNDGSPLSGLVAKGQNLLYVTKSNVDSYAPQF
jgi:ribose transport system substrate-binding protein